MVPGLLKTLYGVVVEVVGAVAEVVEAVVEVDGAVAKSHFSQPDSRVAGDLRAGKMLDDKFIIGFLPGHIA